MLGQSRSHQRSAVYPQHIVTSSQSTTSMLGQSRSHQRSAVYPQHIVTLSQSTTSMLGQSRSHQRSAYLSMSLLQIRCLSSCHVSRLIFLLFLILFPDHVQCSRSDTFILDTNRSCYLLTYIAMTGTWQRLQSTTVFVVCIVQGTPKNNNPLGKIIFYWCSLYLCLFCVCCLCF